MLIFVETFNSKPGRWLSRGGDWSPISINTLQSLQYSAAAQPLSQTRNNVSVRCFVRDLKLLTVTDYWVQRGVKGTELNLETVWKLQIWRGEWGWEWSLWLVVVRVSFLKCDALSQLQDHYRNVLLSRLTLSSFKVNQLYSPDRRGEKPSAAHRKSSSTFCYFSNCIEKAFNHIARPFFSSCLIWTYGLEGLCNFRMFHVGKNYFINGKYCTSSRGWFFKYH